MFIDVKTFFFYTFINAQSVNIFYAIEQYESTNSCPEVNHQDAEALSTEEAPTTTIEGACLSSQQTSHDSTQDTADAVYRTCTYRIVDVQLVINKLNGEYQYRATNQTNNHGTNGRYEITTSGDTYQTCQHTVQGQRE